MSAADPRTAESSASLPLLAGAILDTLAEFAFLDGDLGQATTLVTEALAVQRRHQPLWGTAFSLALLGEIALARSDSTGQPLDDVLGRIRSVPGVTHALPAPLAAPASSRVLEPASDGMTEQVPAA